MAQALSKVFRASLVAVMSVLIARLAESWSLGAPVELAALVLSVLLYTASVAASSGLASRRPGREDPREALELFEKRWQIYFRTVFAGILAAWIIVFVALASAGLLYRLWLWIF